MATLGLLFIGLLFGLFLSLVMAGFLILNLDPRLRNDLLRRRRSVLDLVRPRKARSRTPSSPGRHPELERKIRTLTEEVRVSQKLLEESRQAAESRRLEVEALGRELEDLRGKLAGAEAAREALVAELERRREAGRGLETELAALREQLARREREVRDLTTELDVARAGEQLFQG
jgi:chromosome segregation ATPase